jgi:hypothetical protein
MLGMAPGQTGAPDMPKTQMHILSELVFSRARSIEVPRIRDSRQGGELGQQAARVRSQDRFGSLLQDPGMAEQKMRLANRMLGLGQAGGDGQGDVFGETISSGMEALNLRALGMVARFREEQAQAQATGLSHALRMPVNKAAIETAIQGYAASNGRIRLPVDKAVLSAAVEAEQNAEPQSKARATATAPAAQEPRAAGAVRQVAETPAPAADKAVSAAAPATGAASNSAGAGPVLPVTGELSAMFESGRAGSAAIGYDRQGGTSYGKYQISSSAGTMDRFLGFLEGREPDLAARLRAAGPANTGGRRGGMPHEWRRVAAEFPERFEALQDEFLMNTNYRPALQSILEETRVNLGERSPAVREVLWSTAVQHGAAGAASIFSRAIRRVGGAETSGGGKQAEQDFDKQLIEAVYDRRKRNFGSSTRAVRNAVKSRLTREESMAISLLEGDRSRLA